jgi:hypothetical protein
MFIVAIFTREKGRCKPGIHQQMNESTKYGLYIKRNVTQTQKEANSDTG